MKYGKIFSNKAYRFISIRSAACRTSYYCAKLRVLWDRPREGRLRRLQQPIIDLRTPTHKFPRMALICLRFLKSDISPVAHYYIRKWGLGRCISYQK